MKNYGESRKSTRKIAFAAFFFCHGKKVSWAANSVLPRVEIKLSKAFPGENCFILSFPANFHSETHYF